MNRLLCEFRRRRRNSAGTSLVEVMVTVALMAMVMATVFGEFDSSQTAVMNTGTRLQNLDEARVLMAAVSKDVRTAVRLQAGTSPFTIADKNTATFYANLDTTAAPQLVHIYVDATSELVEQVTPADVGSVAPNYTYTGTPHVRFVGRYVANNTNSPIFTYLDDTDTPLTNYPLNSTDLLAVHSVRITLEVRKSTFASIDPTTLVNQVRLPNLDYNAVAS
jgi:Tfp pilus assembly protein PilW